MVAPPIRARNNIGLISFVKNYNVAHSSSKSPCALFGELSQKMKLISKRSTGSDHIEGGYTEIAKCNPSKRERKLDLNFKEA